MPEIATDKISCRTCDKSVGLSMTQEAATLPMDSSVDLDPSSQGLEEGVWGQLYPHCGSFPIIPLKTDVFRFGRASSCDYVIRETDMGDKKWLTAVSKIQCEIIKTDKSLFVKDRSGNEEGNNADDLEDLN